jgi:hypothetical protein
MLVVKLSLLVTFVSGQSNHHLLLSELVDLHQIRNTSPDQNYVISLKDASEVVS